MADIMSVQLNVKISDEEYAAAKEAAKADRTFLSAWIGNAIMGYIAVRKQAGERLDEINRIRDGLPMADGGISGSRLMDRFFAEERLPAKSVQPKKLAVGKKRTDAPPRPARRGQERRILRPRAGASTGPVRPKINVSELLP